MSTIAADTPTPRPSRQYTDEFKAQTVRLVLDEGKSLSAVARDLDVTVLALRLWVEQTRADTPPPLTLERVSRCQDTVARSCVSLSPNVLRRQSHVQFEAGQ